MLVVDEHSLEDLRCPQAKRIVGLQVMRDTLAACNNDVEAAIQYLDKLCISPVAQRPQTSIEAHEDAQADALHRTCPSSASVGPRVRCLCLC